MPGQNAGYGGMAGAGAGAGLGYALGAAGSVGGPVGTMVGLSLGSAIGGGIGGMFDSGPEVPDISAYLAQIGGLFESARMQAHASINANYFDSRGQAASNLAARGTYRAPVAEHTFTKLAGARDIALADSDSKLYAQEAQTRGAALGQIMGLNYQAQKDDAARSSALFGQLGSIGTSLLMAKMGQPGTTTPNANPQSLPGNMSLDPFAYPGSGNGLYATPSTFNPYPNLILPK